MMCKMQEVEPFVQSMNSSLEINAAFGTAQELKFQTLKHASTTNQNGENISWTTAGQL